MKDLNLIPKSYMEAKKKRLKKVYYTFAAIGVLLVVATMVILPLGTRLSLLRQRNALDMQVKETSNYLAVENQIVFIKDLFRQREAEANKLIALGIDVEAAFKGIEQALPDRLFITSLSIGGKGGMGQISLTGIAWSEDEVATFINYLRKDSRFEEVILSTVNKQPWKYAATGTVQVPAATGQTTVEAETEQSGTSCNFNITMYLKVGK